MTPASLCQVRRELAPACPHLFLRLNAHRPRGFWAAGDRWVAHGGVLDLVAIEQGSRDSADSRFSGVRRRSVRVFDALGEADTAFGADAASPRPPAAGPDPLVRLFGGFSFAPLRSADPVWASFPPALFHLPEVELEHHPERGACCLVVRSTDPDAAERSWRRWAAALRRGAAAGPGRGGGASPAHRGEATAAPGLRRSPSPAARHLPGTERAGWGRMVWQALNTIGSGDAEKIVLARALEVAPDRPVSPADLVIALWEENHGSYVFLFEPVPGDALVGAAPEKIATLVDGVFRATATAGSAGVGADSVETARLARRLFNSGKDRAEHDCVVRDMVARLSGLGCAVQHDVEPHVLALARIQHLETKIAAEVPPGTSLLDILATLHPTPAVCGTPRSVALDVLGHSEPFDRGWYAGPVGWFDSGGGGIFVPALRSAVSSMGPWRLFAGAGIVPGSDPALEWEETELKFRPVLRAIARAGAARRAAAGSG